MEKVRLNPASLLNSLLFPSPDIFLLKVSFLYLKSKEVWHNKFSMKQKKKLPLKMNKYLLFCLSLIMLKTHENTFYVTDDSRMNLLQYLKYVLSVSLSFCAGNRDVKSDCNHWDISLGLGLSYFSLNSLGCSTTPRPNCPY